jgi:hypothetical protein
MVGGIEKNSCLLLGIDLYCFFEGDVLVNCSSLFNCQIARSQMLWPVFVNCWHSQVCFKI